MTKQATETIAKVFAEGKPVFLSFSGGKDALALLKLCEPYAGRFRLIWANTAHTFPHVVQRIRAEGERFGLEEVQSDLATNWRVNGWPSEVATVTSAISVNSDIRLQPWPLCCRALKALPILDHLGRHDGPVILLHGQKLSDGWRTPAVIPANVSVLMPLADWTDDEVYAFLKSEGVELPEQYTTIKNSLDCWICPASWTQKTAPAYAEYLALKYPEIARTVRPVAALIHDHVKANIDALGIALARTEQ